MLNCDFLKEKVNWKTTHFVWCISIANFRSFYPKKRKSIDKSTFASYRRNIFFRRFEIILSYCQCLQTQNLLFFLLRTYKYPVMVYISRMFVVRILTIFIFHEKIPHILTEIIQLNEKQIIFFLLSKWQYKTRYCFDWFIFFPPKKFPYTYWINMEKFFVCRRSIDVKTKILSKYESQ